MKCKILAIPAVVAALSACSPAANSISKSSLRRGQAGAQSSFEVTPLSLVTIVREWQPEGDADIGARRDLEIREGRLEEHQELNPKKSGDPDGGFEQFVADQRTDLTFDLTSPPVTGELIFEVRGYENIVDASKFVARLTKRTDTVSTWTLTVLPEVPEQVRRDVIASLQRVVVVLRAGAQADRK